MRKQKPERHSWSMDEFLDRNASIPSCVERIFIFKILDPTLKIVDFGRESCWLEFISLLYLLNTDQFVFPSSPILCQLILMPLQKISLASSVVLLISLVSTTGPDQLNLPSFSHLSSLPFHIIRSSDSQLAIIKQISRFEDQAI